MSETAENTINEGVEVMSLDDALNYSQSGAKPQVKQELEPEKTEETVETTAKTTEKEPKTDVVEKTDEVIEPVVETSKPIEVIEEKVETKQDTKDPYEDILDEEDRAYLSFKKANKGATRKDYEDSKVDYSAIDRKTLLRQSLREKYGLSDNDATLDEYISDELGIPMDANESEMSLTERVKLRKETDAYINEKKAQQEKWKSAPTEEKVEQKKDTEMVRLEDGTEIPKAQYDKIVENRNKYIKGNQDALNRVNATSFKLEVDDNGSKREIEYSYTFDKEDKNRIQSITSDVVANFNKTYTTNEGFDHDNINIDQAWADQQLRGKMLQKIAQNIRAEAIEEVMSEKGNISLGKQKQLDKQETNGVKIVPLSEVLDNY